jgi:hypothetical protein
MWDYAKLVKDAKLAGGPRRFEKLIFNNGYKKGNNNGYKEGKLDTMIVGIAAKVILETVKSVYDKKIKNEDCIYKVSYKKDSNEFDGTHPEDWDCLLGCNYDNK